MLVIAGMAILAFVITYARAQARIIEEYEKDDCR